MRNREKNQQGLLHGSGSFATTRWSLVLAAGRPSAPASSAALALLCQNYWYPIYAYVRRRGYSADDAEDHVQEFFATLLDKRTLRIADPERGKFRIFLLTVCRRFLIKVDERRRTRKRGSGRPPLSIDVSAGERRYRHEPFHELTPERLYERRWALSLLETVLSRLEAEYGSRNKAGLFNELKVLLTGKGTPASYVEIGRRLQLSEGAVKAAVHRLRRRYRDLIREEIGQTVGSPAEVEEELAHLLSAVRL